MALKYYKNEMGYFTVIADDAAYTAVDSFASDAIIYDSGFTTEGQRLLQTMPLNKVYGTVLIPEGVPVIANTYNTFASVFPACVLVTTPNTASGWYYAAMVNNPARRVGMTRNFNQYSQMASSTSAIIRPESSDYASDPNGSIPFGNGYTTTYNRTQIDYFFMGIIIANTAMTAFKWTRFNVNARKPNQVSLQAHDAFNSVQTTTLTQFFNGLDPSTISSDPYDNLPTPGDGPLPGGGAVGIPGFPGLTATSAGVIGLFTPTAAQMQQLADFMWTDFGGTGTTVEEILQEVVEALKRTISNPLDYIIGLNIIPSQGLSIGGAKVVRFGFISSGVSMPQLANQYFTVDCGALSFDTVCGDTFLDYAPYSKFSIYLPYIGFKDVDPNDFVGHTIGVVYHGDCVTGGVTAYITKDGTVMYQYSGCCALNVPLSSDNWGETISAAINVATGIVAAAATGGAAGLAQGALKGAASVAANPSLLSPQVNHSGAVSGGAGCMGVQFPFVIREAVNFHSTAGFNKSTGYPAYYYKKLGDVTGFTTVIDAHLSNIPMATQDEIQEIESLLESGVIL